MIYVVRPPLRFLKADVDLPASKSISNRVLIIQALSECKFQIDNLADCDDTCVMDAALKNLPETIDVGAAGTSMRFLTAYLAQRDGEVHVITGSERMKQRPIKVLVEALRTLGADIEYMGEVGFPPLRIRGRKLKAEGTLVMDSSVSSQYISAILLIAPFIEGGLKLRLDGDIASQPYITMTLELMRQFGASVTVHEMASVIEVDSVPYHYENSTYTVESDWSAAAFWMEILALVRWNSGIYVKNLPSPSIQGDCKAIEWFLELGSAYMPKVAFIHIVPGRLKNLMLDFKDCPDLAQAMVVSCCMLDRPFFFSGLESLHIKETDRIVALKTELRKLGYVLRGGDGDEGILMWQGARCQKMENPVIETYQDHRMAMAFAPCCLKLGEIRIAHPEVVTKSYPRYWDELRELGFEIEEVQEEC